MTSPIPRWVVEGQPCGHTSAIELRLDASNGTPRRRYYCTRCGARWQKRPNDRSKRVIEGEPCAHDAHLTGHTIEFANDALHYISCKSCGARWVVEEEEGALRRPTSQTP